MTAVLTLVTTELAHATVLINFDDKQETFMIQWRHIKMV